MSNRIAILAAHRAITLVHEIALAKEDLVAVASLNGGIEAAIHRVPMELASAFGRLHYLATSLASAADGGAQDLIAMTIKPAP